MTGNMTKKYILKIILILSVFLLTGIPAEGADRDNDILVIGTSSIWNYNLATARNDAISDALVKGIEDYLHGFPSGHMLIVRSDDIPWRFFCMGIFQ